MVKPYTKAWKEIAKFATASDLVILCALKAFFAKSTNITNRDEIFKSLITKSFTPITNTVKLANGRKPFDTVQTVLYRIKHFYTHYPNQISIFNLGKEKTLEIFGNDIIQYLDFMNFLVSHVDIQPATKRYYSYIFVDQENVEPIYQAVQAAHVAMVIGQNMDKKFDANQVYYQICKSPGKPEELAKVLEKAKFKVEKFYEPDVNRTIAIGIHPVRSDKRKDLTKYELLNFGT